MLIVVKGLNHYSAPLAVREKFALPENALGAVSSEIRQRDNVREALMLCTCNRTELYVRAPSLDAATTSLNAFIREKFQENPDTPEARKWFYHYQGSEAVEHLFRVSSGLDSMVVGEGQVLSQVKAAYLHAMENNATGEILNTLFNQAVKVGKRARTETAISRNAVSVAHAAIDMARQVFSDLKDKNVLIVGAGKMCEVACNHLKNLGPCNITVANRTVAKAKETAALMGASADTLTNVPKLLETADVVITSTAAPHYVIHYSDVKKAVQRRRGRPLYIADIAVPRDVEPDVAKLSSVFLYNIDDLKTVVHENLDKRRKEIVKVETIIMQELNEWQAWLAGREAVPMLTSFRSKIDAIREKELNKALKKFAHLSEDDQQAITLLTRSIVNKILHQPTVRLKESAADNDGAVYMDALQKLFDLETPDNGENSGQKE
jgi:glutamyl-tRNA reductase